VDTIRKEACKCIHINFQVLIAVSNGYINSTYAAKPVGGPALLPQVPRHQTPSRLFVPATEETIKGIRDLIEGTALVMVSSRGESMFVR
jgi:hypothetical protein